MRRGVKGDGAAPRLAGACAPDWIPAYAGMTVIVGGAVGRGRGARAFWIPAYAGMTGMGRE